MIPHLSIKFRRIIFNIIMSLPCPFINNFNVTLKCFRKFDARRNTPHLNPSNYHIPTILLCLNDPFSVTRSAPFNIPIILCFMFSFVCVMYTLKEIVFKRLAYTSSFKLFLVFRFSFLPLSPRFITQYLVMSKYISLFSHLDLKENIDTKEYHLFTFCLFPCKVTTPSLPLVGVAIELVIVTCHRQYNLKYISVPPYNSSTSLSVLDTLGSAALFPFLFLFLLVYAN